MKLTTCILLFYVQYLYAKKQIIPCLVHPSLSKKTGKQLPSIHDTNPPNGFAATYGLRHETNLPFSIDYRKTPGVVTPVRDQGDCGSCWAFSATEALEGQLGLDGVSQVLAPQTFIDCVRQDYGCGGGWPDDALAFAEEHGIASEFDYPYQGNASGVCKIILDDEAERVPIATYATVFYEIRANGSDDALRRALWQYGPLSIAIDASGMLQDYKSGILNDTECSTKYPNHAVLLIGYYGTDGSDDNYWIVKNSWGSNWGEDGFVRFSANVTNICGIGMYATVPYITSPKRYGYRTNYFRHLRHMISIII